MESAKVSFYDYRKPTLKGAADYQTVETGGQYDLKAGKVLLAEDA